MFLDVIQVIPWGWMDPRSTLFLGFFLVGCARRIVPYLNSNDHQVRYFRWLSTVLRFLVAQTVHHFAIIISIVLVLGYYALGLRTLLLYATLGGLLGNLVSTVFLPKRF